ncbi:MAG: hypothetical protein JWR44_1377 [Hymenobacter sp.]|jgi:hypothetical protein|nr:hypothetical protein [Hymenobacter sp.]
MKGVIDLLFQDEEARKKHHTLYMALAASKIIIDGLKEVSAIWQYSAEQPENSFTAGIFGTVLAGVQTGLAVARTAMSLAALAEPVKGFAQGGSTGGGMKGNGMGQLMQLSGMYIGANGKLMDGSGFGVAGVVHEDEYVVPKWMRADPQVAAVEQWLEARHLRGFDGGGATGGSAITLPAPNASPGTDGELTYAVLVQLLDQAKLQTEQLADVRSWQGRLNVQLSLLDLAKGQDELKQVQLESGIRA